MKNIFCLLGFVILLNSSCNYETKENVAKKLVNDSSIMKSSFKVPKDSIFESKIFDTLIRIKQVQQKNKFIDSFSHHEKGIAMLIVQRPDSIKNYYWVQVGYNGPLRFEPYFNFYIYKEGFKIKYLETSSNDLLDLRDMK